MSQSKSIRVVLSFVLASLFVVGAGVGLMLNAFSNTPDFAGMKASVPQIVLSADGKTKYTRSVGPLAPGWVPLNQISNHLLMAVIASEDTSFFSHKGVDYHELKEAIKKDLEEKKWARGASTLTQQVIKNIYLSPEKSIWRKVKEFLWAQQLEKVLSKSQILTFYVNMAEWAPGIYGIGKASHHYFNEPPINLTPKQSAFLAMLLPSPRKYHIYYVRKQLTIWAARRVNQILMVMRSMGFIDDSQYLEARNESLWGEKPLTEGTEQAPESDDREIPPDEGLSLTPTKSDSSNQIPKEEEGSGALEESIDENSSKKQDAHTLELKDSSPEESSKKDGAELQDRQSNGFQQEKASTVEPDSDVLDDDKGQ